jgi:predicted nucleic acid-binding protein
MKCLFDTSVFVAAILTGHTRHAACLPLLQQAQAKQINGLATTHTLAELYSALTRIPQTRISPALAQELIRDNLQTFDLIPLSAEDYTAAISLMVQHQLPGGGIFDALIAQAAIKAQADALLTLNPNHFTRLGEAIAQKVQVPQ